MRSSKVFGAEKSSSISSIVPVPPFDPFKSSTFIDGLLGGVEANNAWAKSFSVKGGEIALAGAEH